MRSPDPGPHRSFADTSDNILRSTGATICPYAHIFGFFLFLYSFLIFSFCYSLLIFLSFLFLFIHIFLSFSSFLFLFFLFFTYYSSSSYSSFLIFESVCCITDMHGAKPFLIHLGPKYILVRPSYSSVHISSYSSLLIFFLLLVLYSSSSYSSITDMRIKHTLGKVTYINGKINDLQRKPRENSSLAKNPPKYTTAYIVQQSNCRGHCQRSCL
jgi:hypothetical protein